MANLPIEFSIKVTGETTGEEYKGVFKIRPRLNLQARLTRDQMRRDLLGVKGDEASQDAMNIATVYSKIWAHLVEAPSWWKDARNGLDLEDEAPAGAVYQEVLRIEKESIDAVLKKGEQAAEALKNAEK